MGHDDTRAFVKNALEAAIRIAVIGVLVVWTYHIVKPFLMPVVWGGIIAIAVHPFTEKVAGMLGGRRRVVAGLFALVVIVALLVPLALLSASTLNALQPWIKNLNRFHLSVPLPPASVNQWPVIGHEVTKLWTLAATNLGTLLRHLEPQIKVAITSLFGFVGGGVKMVVVFLISIVIAAVFLATSESSSRAALMVVQRFAGNRAPEICEVATSTIRAVMLGVVGVAVIQSVMAAAGMLVVGVPFAGLWAILVLVCAVVQIPTILVLGPVAAWVFFSKDNTTVEVLFLLWCLVIGLSDNFLKPLFMGMGVDIPMLVIFVGAIGGMIMWGIIGLFIGAVIVAITYKLFLVWMREQNGSHPPPAEPSRD